MKKIEEIILTRNNIKIIDSRIKEFKDDIDNLRIKFENEIYEKYKKMKMKRIKKLTNFAIK